MDKPKNETSVNRVEAILIASWLLMAAFGDELFALLVFQSTDSVTGFSMGKPWWWIYQMILATIFAVALYWAPRINGVRSE